MSESWETEDKRINDIFKSDQYEVISNPHVRRGRGGRPAIIVKKDKFNVDNPGISCPWGIECIWTVISPKGATSMCKVQKIIVGSFYSPPGSRKKSVLLDHISEVFHQMSSKYQNPNWIICADSNDLKLDVILALSPGFKQVVTEPTRILSQKVLDPVITDLGSYYQTAKIDDPLDSDHDNGSPSDHMMVLLRPLDTIHNKKENKKEEIQVRSYSDENFRSMGKLLENFEWNFLNVIPTQDRMKAFHDKLFEMFDSCFPLKTKLIYNQNEPYVTDALLKMKRKKAREFNKNRQSDKYLELKKIYKEMLSRAKKRFYRKSISKLRTSNPKLFYRNIKKITKMSEDNDTPEVEDLKSLPDMEQAEIIAESFGKISNEYEPLDWSAIRLPPLRSEDYLKITPSEVLEVLKSMNANKAVPKNDISTKIFKAFADQLCGPIAMLINDAILTGYWPEFLKVEIVTPVPKVKSPQTVDDLRKICGLPNLSKILEKVVCKYLIDDMKQKLDSSQYANQKGLSINHYLIKLVDRVLCALDGSTKGETHAVIASFIDWSKAFDRQDTTLAVLSFLKNGVRPCLIPLLMSFFENRTMRVKWHNVVSSMKNLPGGGAQGTSLGIWSYLSQTNDNPEGADRNDIFKFVDDKTTLEVLNLLNIGMATHNLKNNVPNNIPVSNLKIPGKNLKTQDYMDKIEKWTDEKKMKVNESKTKNLIFNFSKNYQFSTDVKLKGEQIETVDKIKLLGTTITNDLRWNENTKTIVKESNKRMQFLHRAAKFTSNVGDLKKIYMLQIRSKLEQSAVVWHSSLTRKNTDDLERVQKSALKLILKERYIDYKNALKVVRLDTLEERRQKLCLKFAKACVRHEKLNDMFPKQRYSHNMNMRHNDKFVIKRARTERLQRSAIVNMQRLLNREETEKKKLMRQISLTGPVNYDCF